jgi:hypothetical protein
MLRTVVRAALAIVVIAAIALGLAWPWPVPKVDWRTPVDQALATDDCVTALRLASAAAGAGSTDAYRLARSLVEGGKCNGASHGPGVGDYLSFISPHRDDAATIENIYGLDKAKLDLPQRRLLTLALFFCAMPYNSINQVDHTALSEVIPGDHGSLMSLNRARRESCMQLLEHVAEGLVNADEPAHIVAYSMLMSLPLMHRTRAGVDFARLMLVMGHVPHPPDKEFTAAMRNFAWLRLEQAARSGDIEAITLIITLLHQGRYRERDGKEAYFWILRLRHIGGPTDPLHDRIERGLSSEDRDSAQMLELLSRDEPATSDVE